MLEQFQEVFANELSGCSQDPVHIDLKNEARQVFLKSRKLCSVLDKLHPGRQHTTSDVVVKGFGVGDSVYARNFAAGPRWKRAEVIKVKGPVYYIVRMTNGDVHHRHRNQLRRAWTKRGLHNLMTTSGFLRYEHLSTWSPASLAQVLSTHPRNRS
ncbi:hypothetical protein HPB50_015941 [Hyalomma asiaticum]|uniref:Uncharacterized protein n=1 Tax=Hyalomma asiaticum TaxID=266040 RepID=A0ACB7S9Q2_HYAAI|nr:hypothetical protein HPB50_015941 [Hyalomma asiaticum]